MANTGGLGSAASGPYGDRGVVALLCGFASVLGWWIGLTAYVIVGGPATGGSALLWVLGVPVLLSAQRAAGLGMFLGVPAVATAAMYLTVRRRVIFAACWRNHSGPGRRI